LAALFEMPCHAYPSLIFSEESGCHRRQICSLNIPAPAALIRGDPALNSGMPKLLICH